MEQLICQACGAKLNWDGVSDLVTCPYCGSRFNLRPRTQGAGDEVLRDGIGRGTVASRRLSPLLFRPPPRRSALRRGRRRAARHSAHLLHRPHRLRPLFGNIPLRNRLQAIIPHQPTPAFRTPKKKYLTGLTTYDRLILLVFKN